MTSLFMDDPKDYKDLDLTLKTKDLASSQKCHRSNKNESVSAALVRNCLIVSFVVFVCILSSCAKTEKNLVLREHSSVRITHDSRVWAIVGVLDDEFQIVIFDSKGEPTWTSNGENMTLFCTNGAFSVFRVDKTKPSVYRMIRSQENDVSVTTIWDDDGDCIPECRMIYRQGIEGSLDVWTENGWAAAEKRNQGWFYRGCPLMRLERGWAMLKTSGATSYLYQVVEKCTNPATLAE